MHYFYYKNRRQRDKNSQRHDVKYQKKFKNSQVGAMHHDMLSRALVRKGLRGLIGPPINDTEPQTRAKYTALVIKSRVPL